MNFARSLPRIIVASIVLSMSLYKSAIAEEVRIRGQVINLVKNTVEVQNSVGQNIKVSLGDEFKILVYQDIKLSDLESNDYLSIPSVTIKGKNHALGVHVFPEAFRGFNEGKIDWDLILGSKMTNATLAQLIDRSDDKGIQVSYGDETYFYSVTEATPITTFDIEEDATINIGQKIVIFAKKSKNGYTAEFVGIHKSGKLPPI